MAIKFYRLLFGFLLVALNCAPVSAQTVKRSGTISGTIVSAKGGEQATLIPSKTWRKANVRQKLKAGDVLRTNRSGTLAIVFADRTQVRLGRNSTLIVREVKRGSPSKVRLQKGRIWGRSPRGRSNLSVETPSATAAIRGTEWSIQAVETNSQLQVFSGSVELSNAAGRLLISGGQAASVQFGQAPVRTVLVNPIGREQMLYFVDVADGLDFFDNGNPVFSEARKQVVAKNWTAALRLFEKLAVTGSLSDRALGHYGAYVAAIQMGEEVAQPKMEEAAESYVALGLIMAFDGDLQKAKDITGGGLKKYPKSVALYVLKARIETLLGEPDKAVATLLLGQEKHPEDIGLLVSKADNLREYQGQPKAARDLLIGKETDYPDNIRLQKSIAKSWIALGAFKEADRIITTALKRRPNDIELVSMHAEILLAQNELKAVKSTIDHALQIDRSTPLAEQAMAEYWMRKGAMGKALEASLNASANRPDFGRGFVALAEINYNLDLLDVATQQLDTADRLDPHSPVNQAARTAIALHRFAADDAIQAAQETLRRTQDRGGQYANLSENQQSGSLVSQSFRFLGLEAWGRYYSDRAFDSFSPISYPDQFINRSDSPFLLRPETGIFDAFDVLDQTARSSQLQGAVLDPLSVANSEKELLFSRRNFVELEVGTDYLTESIRSNFGQRARVNGLINGDVPLGFSLDFERSDFRDELQRDIETPGQQSQRFKRESIDGSFGLELSPSDNIAATIDYRRSQKRFSSLTDLSAGSTLITDRGADVFSSSLFWNHEIGYRNNFSLGGLYQRTKTENHIFFDDGTEIIASEPADFFYLGANHNIAFGKLDIRTGAEYSGLSVKRNSRGSFFAQALTFSGRGHELRLFADARYSPLDGFIVQGQFAIGEQSNIDRRFIFTDLNLNPNNQSTHLDFNFGVAMQYDEGHWLRAGVIRETASFQPFTLSPIAAVGLRGSVVPLAPGARSDSYFARWDAEWSTHFFTSVEYQHQDLGRLQYAVPNSGLEIDGARSRLDRLSLEANLWLPGNWGLRANYAITKSKTLSQFGLFDKPGNSAGGKIPFVSDATGQIGITWAHAEPWRLKARLFADYFGERVDVDGGFGTNLNDYWLLNGTLNWQPFDKALELDILFFNILDKRYLDNSFTEGPGRTLRISASVRF